MFSANAGNKQEICTDKKILTTVDGKSEVFKYEKNDY